MEQELLQAKASLVPLLNCLTTLILDGASITVLSKLGTSGTGFHWQALQAMGVIIQASKLLSSGFFKAKLRFCSSKLPGMLPSALPSCDGRDGFQAEQLSYLT